LSVKKQGFVHGAVILMGANILVKIIGACFKIPLQHIVGLGPMSYFSSAYNFYAMFFMISTAGLPVAVSRMIAAAKAKQDDREVNQIFKLSFWLFFALGIAGTVILISSSKVIASVSEMPELYKCIIIIAPTIFFVCIISAFRGYFQGLQNMTPTAISQVIEAAGKLIIGLSLGYWASKQGYSSSVVASYIIIGLTLSVVLSAVFLFFAKAVATKDKQKNLAYQAPAKSNKQILKTLVIIAIPITIASSITSLSSVIDTLVVVPRLKDIGVGLGMTGEVAEKLYGAYTSMVVTIFNLPPTLIYPFSISIIPMISEAITLNHTTVVKNVVTSTFRLVSILSIPMAIGVAVLSRPILLLLYNNEFIYTDINGKDVYAVDVAAPMLSIIAISILFVTFISVTGACLQAHGYERKSIISTSAGIVAKLISAYILIGNPKIGIYGTPISTTICYLVMLSINFFYIVKYTGIIPNIKEILVKPFIAGIGCGGAAYIAYALFSPIISFKIATVFAIICAAIVYVLLIFLIKGIKEEDVLLLPKGEKILSLLKKCKLMK